MPTGWPTRSGMSRARRRARTGSGTASSPRTPGRAGPGRCKGKAHRPEHLGYAGRRVLISRKWSGKTLADHRGDRKAWLIQTLGLEAPDPARYTWHVVTPSDPDYLPPDKRLLHIVAERNRWQAALGGPAKSRGPRGQSFGNWEGGMTEGPRRLAGTTC